MADLHISSEAEADLHGHHKGPRHANRGVVSYDPKGHIHADNYRRHVCATRREHLLKRQGVQ
jgi:hypothetical protein